MNLRLLVSMRSGLNSRLNPNRLSRMLEPKELQELGLNQREQAVLSALGPGKRAAELYGPLRPCRPAHCASARQPSAPPAGLELIPKCRRPPRALLKLLSAAGRRKARSLISLQNRRLMGKYVAECRRAKLI